MKHKRIKHLSLFAACIFMLGIMMIQPIKTNAQSALEVKAKSAILVNAETGKIIYEKNADVELPPASMTKMMTEYLVWDAIESGQISWDSETQISDYPYSISADPAFSGIGLRQNKKYTVKDLYNAMAINSDNAATIALSEYIAGSEGDFVKMMNKKAKEMGLTDYKFVNSSGLSNKDLGDNYPKGTDPDATNLLSARSAALLAYRIVKDHPKALEISSIPEIEFDGKQIRNWNYMLPHDPKTASSLQQFFYKGVDGLKTGHTDLAGYCFTGTAERNGQRFISVVMKTDSEATRFKETAKLFDYGFTNFQTKELFAKGYQLKGQKSLPVVKGKKDTAEIAIKSAIEAPIKNNEKDKYTIKYHIDKDKLTKDGELKAPIKKGEKVGTAELVYKDKQDFGYITGDKKTSVDIVTTESVEKNNWFMLMLGAIGSFFSNLFSTIVDMVKGWF